MNSISYCLMTSRRKGDQTITITTTKLCSKTTMINKTKKEITVKTANLENMNLS